MSVPTGPDDPTAASAASVALPDEAGKIGRRAVLAGLAATAVGAGGLGAAGLSVAADGPAPGPAHPAMVGPAGGKGSGSPGTLREIRFWHAMSGELGRALERVVAGFNAAQGEYRVVPVYKGSYTETVTAAIFAVRSGAHPAIVQVNEIGTATMMAAKGAICPVDELMHDAGEPFDASAIVPAVAGFYSDMDGKLLSYPFNASTPILYYNKTRFRAAGLDPKAPPKTWPELEKAAARLQVSGMQAGFSTHWPSWVNVENFSAYHDLPIATRANGLRGLDAELTLSNPLLERHLTALASWQQRGIFRYGGRGTTAEPMFPNGVCGIFIGSSALAADVRANARFEIGYGMLPYWPDVPAAPRNTMIGGASLWVLRGRPDEEYRGVARFFAWLGRPDIQSAWHRETGYLPITRAAYEASRAQGFYEEHPDAELAIREVTLNPPTDNSRALRLGSFILVRDVIEEEMEAALAGGKTAKAALDAAVARGNEFLRQFERASR
ncbi:Glycerol-3-phosphate ABC transporter protein [Rhodovulum sp. PH10]|uniref:sn-glycerol-3-phosphate ABC transporter substrate-binding protein UgpB n=1 Tax=Rhodovulum sp. PH10 TaxID=1187851 RepID=UPI00027C2450|nr:sn-glycerol-3-phosphate ABC transporter substrate-binding protein UgpB [Rhodovulum sp. PH10]EJW13685.1 Glycerol-3-phosphate ABC transporter protein [Rhodovulum sp. PH10]